MARVSRQTIHEDQGGYHIISRITGQQFLMDAQGKDYFVNVLHLLCKAYFIELHAYCVMDNHFHVLVTMKQEEAVKAGAGVLLEKLNTLRNFRGLGKSNTLRDEKIDKIRERLGSISRFVQDLKQEYSRWFNKKHKRTGYLWGDRFRGVLISHGRAQLACAAYVEMNPVRAGVVKEPEQYPWSSSGLIALDSERANEVLTPVYAVQEQGEAFENYREFVRSVMDEENEQAKETVKRFGLQDLDLWMRNPCFSQGCVLGDSTIVEQYRENTGRRQRQISSLFGIDGLGVTRVLHRGYGFP
jgi:REP element-mobilizing transposase RayT